MKTFKHCGIEVIQKSVTKDGKRYNCGIGVDKDGFYATTHRARSKSYPSKRVIPHKDLEFIASTAV